MSRFFTPTFCSMGDLLILQTQSLYDAEQRLGPALRTMAESVCSTRLSGALTEYSRECERQLARLDVLFEMLAFAAVHETCEPIKALISEGEGILRAEGELGVKDAAIIALAQRIAHHKIAAYDSASTISRQLGHDQIDKLLKESLSENLSALERFAEIAEASINLALVCA
jgi:ferritin-like metal-binding protein YciE